MVIHNVDNLLKETSEVTSYPPDVIMSVIDHQFKSLYDYIDKPTSPGIRFPYLGLFSPKYRAVVNYLHLLIRKLRLDRDNEQLKERFRAYWKVRLLVKKDVERRNYKKRFGSWHYK